MTHSKPHNNGTWTTARFHSFVKGALRAAARRWPPKSAVKKAAWRERGQYLCVGYKRHSHIVPLSVSVDGKRKTNIETDHIEPIVDPNVGFISWDQIILRMFCEAENLQILCRDCHRSKTADERKIRNKNG